MDSTLQRLGCDRGGVTVLGRLNFLASLKRAITCAAVYSFQHGQLVADNLSVKGY